MPKLDVTKDELALLDQALDQSIGSAKRQQNMKGKTPMITEVYKKQEHILNALRAKLATAS